VANAEHLKLLRQGVDVWNDWRAKEPLIAPDLGEADLQRAHLSRANLSMANLGGSNLRGAKLQGANLGRANLRGANLRGADLGKANLREIDLRGADLRDADLRLVELTGSDLRGADFREAKLHRANLSGAHFSGAKLMGAVLIEATLSGVDLSEVDLYGANVRKADLDRATLNKADLRGARLGEAKLRGAQLRGAKLSDAHLGKADLRDADLSGADLFGAVLVETNLMNADLTGCHVYGVSAWNVKLNESTKQQDLVVTDQGEPEVTVDNIEVAQFVYLLLHNAKIRDVIDTVGKKGVLLLGRFTEGRIAVLERLRDELRKRGYLPIVFNFDKPETKDFTETVRLLAGLSHFVIADITNPKSAPLELQATVPEIMVPFRPIIEEGEKPFAMLEDLWIKHREWVFEPLYYSSLDALIGALDAKIIEPAKIRFAELLARKADKMKGEHV
jgi:uncharacterized protein YjbI with pentapeptide repeats